MQIQPGAAPQAVEPRRLRLFISWSGEISGEIAEILQEWIPLVIHDARPFVSSTEIRAGTRWPIEIARTLNNLNYGILCLTPHNTKSTWLNFEAGALSKSMDESVVVPLLFGFARKEDVPAPLNQFQSLMFNEREVKAMMSAINDLSPSPMTERQFDRVIAAHWPDLEAKIRPLIERIQAPIEEHGHREVADPILNEILDLVRSQQRTIDRVTGDPFFSFRGTSRLEPLRPGDYRQLALGLAMLKNMADAESHGNHIPAEAIVRTLFMLREPLETILGRAYAPRIHSLYFDDERGVLRMEYTEDHHSLNQTIDEAIDQVEQLNAAASVDTEANDRELGLPAKAMSLPDVYEDGPAAPDLGLMLEADRQLPEPPPVAVRPTARTEVASVRKPRRKRSENK